MDESWKNKLYFGDTLDIMRENMLSARLRARHLEKYLGERKEAFCLRERVE